jgi:hypothetical protein
MRAKHILALIQNDYTTVEVAYNKDSTNTYTFKALKADEITANDLVVVPANTKFDYTVAQVVAVHDEPQIDTSAPYDYKWIVGKVNLKRYAAIEEVEARFEKTLRMIERKRVQNSAIQEFTSAFPEGSAERIEIDKLMSGYSSLAQIESLETKE